MAINTLRQMGVAVSVSTMDGEGQEGSLPAVVMLPPTVVLTPPPDPNQIAVIEAPTKPSGRADKIARVRAAMKSKP